MDGYRLFCYHLCSIHIADDQILCNFLVLKTILFESFVLYYES
jgi:hypothetical protein